MKALLSKALSRKKGLQPSAELLRVAFPLSSVYVSIPAISYLQSMLISRSYSSVSKDTEPRIEMDKSNLVIDPSKLFLHISPSGDFWIASEIFAAKHLPEGYVKSIRIPENFEEETLNALSLADIVKMYDTGKLL
jgi:hypothetical protein